MQQLVELKEQVPMADAHTYSRIPAGNAGLAGQSSTSQGPAARAAKVADLGAVQQVGNQHSLGLEETDSLHAPQGRL